MPALRDEALILRRFPYGESSLVLHALTRAHGRVHLLAKGAYRPTSRFYAALDVFDTLEITWSHAAGRELQVVQEATIAARRHRIARALPAYRAGLTVLELAGLGALEGHDAAELFDAAVSALDLLGAADEHDLGAVTAALVEFELRFLQNLGLAPALAACASCGGAAPPLDSGADGEPRAAFSAGAGGRLCRACALQARAVGRRVGTLPVRVLDRALAILERRADEVPRDADELELVRDAVARFLEYHLEGRPKSYRSFLAVPNRNRPTA